MGGGVGNDNKSEQHREGESRVRHTEEIITEMNPTVKRFNLNCLLQKTEYKRSAEFQSCLKGILFIGLDPILFLTSNGLDKVVTDVD